MNSRKTVAYRASLRALMAVAAASAAGVEATIGGLVSSAMVSYARPSSSRTERGQRYYFEVPSSGPGRLLHDTVGLPPKLVCTCFLSFRHVSYKYTL